MLAVVFETGYNWSLTADWRAYRVGDILTVILEESTQSSKQAKTNFGKTTPSISVRRDDFGHTKDKLSGSIDANCDFDGSATPSSRTVCAGRSSSVHAVQPNGIHRKFVARNGSPSTGGDEYIRLKRPCARRRYSERQLGFPSADRRCPHLYAGRGALSDANAAGWLTRLFNHPLFPDLMPESAMQNWIKAAVIAVSPALPGVALAQSLESLVNVTRRA